MGQQGVERPDWPTVRARFDCALTAPVDGDQADEDTDEVTLLRALGLR